MDLMVSLGSLHQTTGACRANLITRDEKSDMKEVLLKREYIGDLVNYSEHIHDLVLSRLAEHGQAGKDSFNFDEHHVTAAEFFTQAGAKALNAALHSA